MRLRRGEPDRRRSAARRCRWGFNRTPHYTRGLLLVGDADGMVNPFNGEGISCAMESGEIAAQVIVQALARPGRGQRAELALRATRGR